MTLDTATIIYIASCIGVIGTAIKILVSAKKALTTPLDEINKKLQEHCVFLENDKRRLEEINGALEDLTEGVHILIKNQQTILDHLEDGNHSGEIRAGKKRLNEWLVDSRSANGR